MGRTAEWLAAQRPAMVEILREMERGSVYTGDGLSRGDLSMMFARLAHVLKEKDGRLRKIETMRQAWWRWTTNGEQAATPVVEQLALVVRHAKNHGWLKKLRRRDCRALVNRLMAELDKARAAKRRALEVAWSPTARVAVEGLIDFLEAQIAKHADVEGDLAVKENREMTWGLPLAPALVVQEEAGAMVKQMVEHIVLGLRAPREVFVEPVETDGLIQPFEGWSAMLRGMAASVTEILEGAAKDLEEYESSLIPTPTVAPGGPTRKNLFPRSTDEPSNVE